MKKLILIFLTISCGIHCYLQCSRNVAESVVPTIRGLTRLANKFEHYERQLSKHWNPAKLIDVSKRILQGKGQIDGNREYLHIIGARRDIKDVQMWTHSFFLVGMIESVLNGVKDLAVLLAITTTLSLLYHHRYEEPGIISSLESISAKALFAYGVAQIPRVSDPILMSVEIICSIATVLILIITNFRPSLYDPWHCLMHIVPAIWSLLVAMFHKPIDVF